MQSRGAIVSCLRTAAVAGLAMLPVVLTSCGPGSKAGDKRLPVFPLQGEVFVNDKPGTGILIMLEADPPLQQPAEARGSISPRATVDETGKFIVETYTAGDGAPAAKYILKLTAPLTAGGFSKGDTEEVDRLEGAYNDSKKNAADSQLVFTVTEADPKGEPQKIPRINLKVDGFEESDPKKAAEEVTP